MSYRQEEIHALVAARPREGEALLLKAIREAGGNISRAAKRLDVHRASINRWLGELGLWDDVEAIRSELNQKFRAKP